MAMKGKNSALFSSVHVEWGTPPDLRESLNNEFNFTLDPCAPGQTWDGLQLDWSRHRVFCNPPYGRNVDKWLAKGRQAELAVFLLPSRTDTAWFHEYALKSNEIRFFRGRLRFNNGHVVPRTNNDFAPFPSMLVIFRGKQDSTL